jgi:hypothetical protein
VEWFTSLLQFSMTVFLCEGFYQMKKFFPAQISSESLNNQDPGEAEDP